MRRTETLHPIVAFVQGSKVAIIIGVCVGGLAVAIMATVFAGKRKVRSDEYVYTADSTMGTTAAFTDTSGPLSQTLPHAADETERTGDSGNDSETESVSLAPQAVSPAAASPRNSPQVPLTMFVDDEDPPPAGCSEEGSHSETMFVTCAAAGPPSASGQPTTLSLPGQVAATTENGGNAENSHEIGDEDLLHAVGTQ